jgi:hypothetical protein
MIRENPRQTLPMMMSLTAVASGGMPNDDMRNGFTSPTIQNYLISACDGLNDSIHNAPAPSTRKVTIQPRLGVLLPAGCETFGDIYLFVASYNGNETAFNNSCH